MTNYSFYKLDKKIRIKSRKRRHLKREHKSRRIVYKLSNSVYGGSYRSERLSSCFQTCGKITMKYGESEYSA